MGFVRDLVQACSVGSVEDAVELVGLSFVATTAGAQRFAVDAHASNRHFFRLSIWTVAHRRGTLPCRITGRVGRRSELLCRFG